MAIKLFYFILKQGPDYHIAFICLLLFCPLFAIKASAQTGKPVSVVDFVKIKDGKKAEAMYFYENNWKVYRDIALKKEYIRSYKMLITQPDSAANFDIMLITEFANEDQYKKSEPQFNLIIKENRPTGAKLLNELKPADFRISLYSKIAECIFSAPQ
jgi:hypothetical protein